MEHLWVVLGVAIVLFVSTNVDDMFILLAFFAEPGMRAAHVVAGQFAGMIALIVLSMAGSLLALVVAPAYVGLLGLAPLVLGILMLVRLLRGVDDDDDDDRANMPVSGSGLARIAAIALVTVANGGDNIGVYVPVFASHTRSELAVFTVVFLLLTGLWCWMGYYLVHHPQLGAPIRRYARPVTPLVLMALGLYIVIESKAYSLLPSLPPDL